MTDKTNPNPEQGTQQPAPGTPEHEAAMASKFDAAEAAAAAEQQDREGMNSDRPEWLPEKFKSAEDLAAAYAELERKLGAGGDETPNEESDKKSDKKSEGDTPDGTPEGVKSHLNEKGLDFDAMAQEYAAEGALPEARYAELEKAGLPRAMVDQWIAGQQAITQSIVQEATSLVGGQDEYAAMQQWAASNLSPGEIEAFNRATMQGREATLMAVRGLRDRYNSEMGEGDRVRGRSSGSAGRGAGFESAAQVTEAMRDPRYQSDPAYRKHVMERLQRSKNVF